MHRTNPGVDNGEVELREEVPCRFHLRYPVLGSQGEKVVGIYSTSNDDFWPFDDRSNIYFQIGQLAGDRPGRLGATLPSAANKNLNGILGSTFVVDQSQPFGYLADPLCRLGKLGKHHAQTWI
jgi:hypothetical protein